MLTVRQAIEFLQRQDPDGILCFARIRTGAGWLCRGAFAKPFECLLVLFQIRLHAGDDALELDQLSSRQGRWHACHQIRQASAQLAFPVHEADGRSKVGVGDGGSELLLEPILECGHLRRPLFQRVGVIRLVRHLKHVHRLRFAQQFKHLFLAVAGRLRNDEIGPLQEWITVQRMISEGGLDQGTKVGGQHLFRGRDRRRVSTAEADRHTSRRQDQLARREFA